MKIRSLAIVAAAFIVTAVATPALAVYHPGTGRFMQRDPHGTMNAPTAPRVGMAGPAAAGGFVARDPIPTQPQPGLQYADGMNLYQYVRSRPLYYTDSQGLVGEVRNETITDWVYIDKIIAMPWGANQFAAKKIKADLPEGLKCLQAGDNWTGTWQPDSGVHLVRDREYIDHDVTNVNWKGAIVTELTRYRAWAVKYQGTVIESETVDNCTVEEIGLRPRAEIDAEQQELDDAGETRRAWRWEWKKRKCDKCCLYTIRPDQMAIWADKMKRVRRLDFATYAQRRRNAGN